MAKPSELAYLSTTQMSTLLRTLDEEYSLGPSQISAQSGERLASLAQHLLLDDLADRPIVVLAGRGQKGAAGLAAARHLLAWGAWVQVVLTHPPTAYAGLAAEHLARLQTLAAPLAWAEEGWELPPADLLIDALVGCGLRGAPSGKLRELIQLANSSVAPILSLLVPSGLDADTGALATPHIHASATLALGWPLAGLGREPGRTAAGDLYLADVGVPPQLYQQLGVPAPPHLGRDRVVAWHVENSNQASCG